LELLGKGLYLKVQDMTKNTIKNLLYQVGGCLVGAYSKIMFTMDISRHKGIPKGAKIIVANHPTTIDPFILTSISNGQAAVLIKDVLFDVPIFGKYLHLAGHIPVGKMGGKIAFEKALEKLKSGITVIVFIEGDLSQFLNKIKKPKTGAIRLALLSGKPIIPIGISVRKKNVRWIKSVIKGVQEWGKWYFKGPYAMSIGKPINLTGNVEDRNKVKYLTGWLSRKISILAKESTKRLKLSI
jgi:1-acyl-sn-glycerol-3-phosphate acyltransferase